MGHKRKWWAQRDLNPRPSDYESPALTAELWAHRNNQPNFIGMRGQKQAQFLLFIQNGRFSRCVRYDVILLILNMKR